MQYHSLEQAPPGARRGLGGCGQRWVPKLVLASGGFILAMIGTATLTPLLFSTGKVGSEMLQVMNWTSGDGSDRGASGNPV